MLYKPVEISTVKATGLTFFRVPFWRDKADFDAGKPWDRKNDFLMQLRSTGERVVTNAEGWPKRKDDGKFIDPATLDPEKPEPEWERETFDRDLPAEIRANIEAYWERAEANEYPPDHTSIAYDLVSGWGRETIERDQSDPHGVLARPDVMALKDAQVEVLSSQP